MALPKGLPAPFRHGITAVPRSNLLSRVGFSQDLDWSILFEDFMDSSFVPKSALAAATPQQVGPGNSWRMLPYGANVTSASINIQHGSLPVTGRNTSALVLTTSATTAHGFNYRATGFTAGSASLYLGGRTTSNYRVGAAFRHDVKAADIAAGNFKYMMGYSASTYLASEPTTASSAADPTIGIYMGALAGDTQPYMYLVNSGGVLARISLWGGGVAPAMTYVPCSFLLDIDHAGVGKLQWQYGLRGGTAVIAAAGLATLAAGPIGPHFMVGNAGSTQQSFGLDYMAYFSSRDYVDPTY